VLEVTRWRWPWECPAAVGIRQQRRLGPVLCCVVTPSLQAPGVDGQPIQSASSAMQALWVFSCIFDDPVQYVLPSVMLDVRRVLGGRCAFPVAAWFADLDATRPAAKVSRRNRRIEQGTLSVPLQRSWRGSARVSASTSAPAIECTSGWTVTAGDSARRVRKKRQSNADIEIAKSRWTDYKQRKRHPR